MGRNSVSALDDPEDERLPVGEGAGLLADARDREHDRDDERRAGAGVDADAAHSGDYRMRAR